MSPRWAALFVACLLVLTQEAALLHVLTHHGPQAATPGGAPAHDPDTGDRCATCLAFAHVAFALAAPDVAPAVPIVEDHWIREAVLVRLPVAAPDARARDPPSP